MIIRTRFAPSPTGKLHLGHALAAKIARDLARPDGHFLLRYEDLDGPRVRPEFYQGIEEDLKWMGLDWDGEPLRQTSRTAAYESALSDLKRRRLVYPCFCTRREIQEELAKMASAPQGPEGPVYPGTCRHRTGESIREKIASGAAHAWRLDSNKAAAETGALSFSDLRFGRIQVDHQLLGDVVLARKDIGSAYHLAVVVDDAFQEITHVTRGEDLLTSTHVHRLLQVLLGLPEPAYFHHRLVLDEDGKRLAKRSESESIAALREASLSALELMRRISD